MSCRQTQWWSSSQSRSRRSQRKTSPGIEWLKQSVTKTIDWSLLPLKKPLLLFTSKLLKSGAPAVHHLLNVEKATPQAVPHVPNVEGWVPCGYLPSKCWRARPPAVPQLFLTSQMFKSEAPQLFITSQMLKSEAPSCYSPPKCWRVRPPAVPH